METTLTKRTLSGAVVKALSVFDNSTNSYKITTQIEKTGHSLLIGGTVKIKISGLSIYSNLLNEEPIVDFFNQEKSFFVVDANTIRSENYIKSKLYNNGNSLSDTLTIISGTPIVQINNDKILLESGSYNFELLNKLDYSYLRAWDLNYRFKIKELGIGNQEIYNGAPDYYSDTTLNDLPDLNEQDLNFRFCKSVEISIAVDKDGNNIPDNDFTKTTNIGIIINKI